MTDRRIDNRVTPLMGRVHFLKVVPPYYDALADGSKNFEVRNNDRGYQKGDKVVLWEYGVAMTGSSPCKDFYCQHWEETAPDDTSLDAMRHEKCKGRWMWREITYVYTGDTRYGFAEIPAGTVVLALGPIIEEGTTNP